jgi:hypothetical protein
MHFSRSLQNSQFLQGLGSHQFGWAFLVAKVSRKSPKFCNKFEALAEIGVRRDARPTIAF